MNCIENLQAIRIRGVSFLLFYELFFWKWKAVQSCSMKSLVATNTLLAAMLQPSETEIKLTIPLERSSPPPPLHCYCIHSVSLSADKKPTARVEGEGNAATRTGRLTYRPLHVYDYDPSHRWQRSREDGGQVRKSNRCCKEALTPHWWRGGGGQKSGPVVSWLQEPP